MSKWMRTPERKRPHAYIPDEDKGRGSHPVPGKKPEYKPCAVCRRMKHHRLHQSWWWRVRNSGQYRN